MVLVQTYVEVDVEDVLDDLDDKQLADILKRRKPSAQISGPTLIMDHIMLDRLKWHIREGRVNDAMEIIERHEHG